MNSTVPIEQESLIVKFVVRRRCAHKILEIANSAEAVQDGRMHIEKINAPFIYQERESQAEYRRD